MSVRDTHIIVNHPQASYYSHYALSFIAFAPSHSGVSLLLHFITQISVIFVKR